ncbi:MAG: hypothetical protein GC206_15895 [Alphaproteobacteria bacterium]|nr:hypothetical protein [Alphaproteobacteria bacterium]
MRRFSIALAAWAIVVAPLSAAEFRALSPEEGGAILSASDDFTSALSPADLSIRLRRPDGGNLDDLMALYRRSTQAWTEAEHERLQAMVARVQARTDAVAQWLPAEIGFIKVSEAVEGGFPHTRGNAIIWGPSLPETDAMLDYIFFHELWHVLSRRHAARRDEMYALIGFAPCSAVDWPRALVDGRLTNPDSPQDRHVVAYENGAVLLPRLMAAAPRYDANIATFGDYLLPQFLVAQRGDDGRCTAAAGADGPILLDLRAAAPYLFAAAGRNTNYIMQPEEIMADNFAQLMVARSDAPDPQVQARIAAWLRYVAPEAD